MTLQAKAIHTIIGVNGINTVLDYATPSGIVYIKSLIRGTGTGARYNEVVTDGNTILGGEV